MDFDQENSIEHLITPKPFEEIIAPTISFNPDFNPFAAEKKSSGTREQHPFLRDNNDYRNTPIPNNWDTLYEISKKETNQQQQMHDEKSIAVDEQEVSKPSERQLFQIHNRFILSQIKSGFMLIGQQAAHERILYERFLQQLQTPLGRKPAKFISAIGNTKRQRF